MCAFMAPIGELILDSSEATAGAGFLSNMWHHFEEPVKKFAIEEAGQLVGNFARSHPGGVVDQTLASASGYRKITRTKTKTTRPTRKLSR